MNRNLLTAAALACASFGAHAGLHCNTDNCPPDNWGGYSAHISHSAAIGVVSEIFVPATLNGLLGIRDPVTLQLAAFGVCMIPGTMREWWSRDEPGNRFSNRDEISNAVGCALGMAIPPGVRWALTASPATKSIRVTYSVTLP
jgi:hypothetical protein